ncbi:hypothetical protein [Paraburkholderia sp.]|uniref:hypothetical protein n=1 Tax=Paraburkholderia sp. TaxID=1926495 RepID=UPI0023957120|nr:hypothetical protein [Paraburkholderia sp.]MDE1180267.1 hypothetical protein [Paraburkholderia sp.]
MRHTVIGLFDTYSQADEARDTLVQTGFGRDTIELQANPAHAAGTMHDPAEHAGVWANIERFISSLFARETRVDDARRYTDAVRAGAVLVCVNATSEAHAELARDTLQRLGASDIGERLPGWDAPVEATREHSLLDELGLGAVTPVPGAATPSVVPNEPLQASRPVDADPMLDDDLLSGDRLGSRPMTASEPISPSRIDDPMATSPLMADPLRDPLAPMTEPLASRPAEPVPDATPVITPVSPLGDPLVDPYAPRMATNNPAADAIAAGSVLGGGAVMPPPVETVRETDRPSMSMGSASAARMANADTMPPASTAPSGRGATLPDEYLEYEEDFRGHFDDAYAAEGSRYEDYVPAYHYGASMGHDARYSDRAWDDVESDARRDWETRDAMGTAGGSSWERFKLAVQHGWERVTGHHHHV